MEPKKHIRVVAAEIEKDGRYLITQRRPQAVLPLLWEFPSGRVEEGETDEEALRRELMERLGAKVEVGALSMFVQQSYETYDLDFCVYHCELLSDELQALRVNDWRFVTTSEIDNYEFPAADLQTVQRLLYGAPEDQV